MFLLSLRPDLSFPKSPSPRRGLDLGAGIGRVTQSVLLPILGPQSKIEMIEPTQGFVEAARIRSDWNQHPGQLQIWQMRVQDFWNRDLSLEPAWSHQGEYEDEIKKESYDLIWCQWSVWWWWLMLLVV